jgi:hypothetical protein
MLVLCPAAARLWGIPIRPVASEAGVFGPEEIEAIAPRSKSTLEQLELVDRNDPAVTMVTKFMIEIAKQGERDPVRLRQQVVKLMS